MAFRILWRLLRKTLDRESGVPLEDWNTNPGFCFQIERHRPEAQVFRELKYWQCPGKISCLRIDENHIAHTVQVALPVSEHLVHIILADLIFILGRRESLI